ncbi:arsenate reductase ArsC [Paeniglutamicibacter sulfureus]|uniref:arsenate reductase ArsC n=1 Tax=Paeniglutamicibacter sulfureus TaxID=43666 RepID=UPI0026657B36|nr:arsenate reductase ArsC [Paeniglutamicibacter sulfureus]MDO2934124.1 arsenate reductase ArsC [Paeniglutamicibacter sulfureus]
MEQQQTAPDSTMDTHVLHRSAGHLSERYAGIFAPEMVERYVFESYATLGRTAKVRTYLATISVRFADDRLHALAQSMGSIAKEHPQVLFVCVQNAGRSQMAAALLSTVSGGKVEVRSAGSLPAGEIHPLAMDVMKERGIDLADAFPKPLTDDVVRAADYVITMGCGDTCPIYPGKQYLDWDVADPENVSLEDARAILSDIETRVHALWERIKTT